MAQTTGQRIAQERRKLGLSQEALGEKLGVSRQAISKWESDTATPEVEKLIALSQQFSVSVGYLLGTEEESAAVPSPEPPLPISRRLLIALTTVSVLCAIAAFLCIPTTMRVLDRFNQMQQAYYQELNELRGDNVDLHNEVGLLSRQLTQLLEGMGLLSEYTLDLAAGEDLTTVTVTLHAMPQTWPSGSSAALSIRQNGQAVTTVPCDWDGSACTAQAELAAGDGYSYYYILTHPDGTQEQQALDGQEDLASQVRFLVDVNISWMSKFSAMTADHVFFLLHPPVLLNDEGMHWESVELTFLRNGEPMQTISMLDYAKPEQLTRADLDINTSLDLPFPDLSSSDVVEVKLSARLSNGMTYEEIVDTVKVSDYFPAP